MLNLAAMDRWNPKGREGNMLTLSHIHYGQTKAETAWKKIHGKIWAIPKFV